jgi:hypothetical protein
VQNIAKRFRVITGKSSLFDVIQHKTQPFVLAGFPEGIEPSLY